jgi:hypothetical protein
MLVVDGSWQAERETERERGGGRESERVSLTVDSDNVEVLGTSVVCTVHHCADRHGQCHPEAVALVGSSSS